MVQNAPCSRNPKLQHFALTQRKALIIQLPRSDMVLNAGRAAALWPGACPACGFGGGLTVLNGEFSAALYGSSYETMLVTPAYP